jgi:uncharacterized membrane protein
MDESRIDRLEERLSALEAGLEEVRDTLAKRARLEHAAPVGRPTLQELVAEAQELVREAEAATVPAAETGEPAPALPKPKMGLTPLKERLPEPPRDLESWLGQNALLVVGVLALVAAVAFTLKYAFDQGWVSPAARVGAGLIAGLVVAAYGERLIRRGLGRFGAGLLGAGAAIAYLSAWAAAGPFQFVSAGVGIAALAVISGLVLMSALRHSESYLAGLAAAGAYMAPILLGEPGSVAVLLAYSVVVSAGAGAVAVLRGWHGTYLVVILGFFVLGGLAGDEYLWLLGAYTAFGGGALLAAAWSRGWQLHGLLAWALAWLGLWFAGQAVEGWHTWIFVLGPAALVWPVWRKALLTARETAGDAGSMDPWEILDTVVFYATALLWTAVATDTLSQPVEGYPLVVTAVLALPYLAPGLLRGHASMHLAALGMLAVGVLVQWDGLGIAAALVLLAVFAAVTTRTGSLARNRWAGLALAAMAAYELFRFDAEVRPADDAALVGRWAAVLYLQVVSIAAIAGPLWKKTEPRWEAPGGFTVRIATWLLAAVVALAGGTIDIPAFVVQSGGSEFAAGLAVSAYWLVLAGGLLAYGFWKDLRAVRITGLAVAALAVGKVLFVDLAELRALYRVGSLALLAVITLLAARAYHRRE